VIIGGGMKVGPLPGNGIGGRIGGPPGAVMTIGGRMSGGSPANVNSGGTISGGVTGNCGISAISGMIGTPRRTLGRARA
jgi:hypothetical protein